MKLLVCCLLVILKVSNNGRASLDSFIPINTNILFEDITKSSDKDCYRPCKFNVKPRRCHYYFKIQPTILEDGKPALTVNGIIPGPPIHVCLNDIIIVKVQNKVPDQDVTFHWHGIEQKGTPYMDGVPMVTQCPIAYGSTYKYAFRASTPGTYFYHSYSVSHQSDGLYGVIIVNQPHPLEPHSSLYDYDRSKENTLVLSAKFSELFTASLENVSQLKPSSLVINGNEISSKLFVMPGFAYRLRLINAIAVECPVNVNIESHDMVIIASDGKPVKAVPARKVRLYPGERMDVVLRASQNSGGYWIRVAGSHGVCAGLEARAMFVYSGFNYTNMLQQEQSNENVENELENEIPIYGQMLESLHAASHNTDVKSVYLGIDRNIVKFKESDSDFRYISDAMPKKPFFPASLSIGDNSVVVQINGKSFLYPNAPILLKPRDVNSDTLCLVGEEYKQRDPQCVQILNAVEKETLEIVLINEGANSNDSYTFHMHGYSMQVVATWQNRSNIPFSKKKFRRLDKERRITRNLQYPPLKDTIVVPNKGYAIVRMKPDYGGSWMLECRSCGVSSLPTAILINVPQMLPKSVVDSLPKCGNYKPPDVLLN